MRKKPLPDWLMLWIWKALIGEIYPAIRAVAVSFSGMGELAVRYYLDREPIALDYESLAVVITHILANSSSNCEIKSVKEECLFSNQPLGLLDPMDGFVYMRREYQG